MDIYCSHDDVIDLDSLKEHPRNPNTHNDNQIDLLANIIKQQGWRAPITISNRSGNIVRGHGRLYAAQALGLESAPVDYQDYENDEEEWADLIADNRIAELSDMDRNMLKDVLQDIDNGSIELSLTGYDEEQIESMMTEVNIDDFFDEVEEEGGEGANKEVAKELLKRVKDDDAFSDLDEDLQTSITYFLEGE